MALARKLLSVENLNLLTKAVNQSVKEALGENAPPFEIRFGDQDVFSRSVIKVVNGLGWQEVTPDTLYFANKEIVKQATNDIFTEQLQFLRWKSFLEHGVNPTMIERPEVDGERARRKELQKPWFGHMTARTNPFEKMYGGCVDEFKYNQGIDVRDTTGSDEQRIHVIKDFPLPRART